MYGATSIDKTLINGVSNCAQDHLQSEDL